MSIPFFSFYLFYDSALDKESCYKAIDSCLRRNDIIISNKKYFSTQICVANKPQF